MIPTKLYTALAGFDEDYFMYGEDIDLCYRAKEAGWRVRYCAKAHMTHHKGSSAKGKKKTVNVYFYQTMAIFYDKHYAKRYGFIVSALVHAAIKWKIWMLRKADNQSRESC